MRPQSYDYTTYEQNGLAVSGSAQIDVNARWPWSCGRESAFSTMLDSGFPGLPCRGVNGSTCCDSSHVLASQTGGCHVDRIQPTEQC